MKKKLVVIVGPTAVGKTALSIQLCHKYNGEVISGDSMQVYKGLDIGTAKVSKAEQEGVPHHLIDIKDPSEPFSVAEFKERCEPLIEQIHAAGRLPFLVGGTGLYVNAVTKGYQLEALPVDEAYRQQLEAFAEAHGKEALHGRLREADARAAELIHPNNVRRVIRALEVTKVTGRPFSAQQQDEGRHDSPYELTYIGLTMERELLYKRINQRVDQMITAGLIEEARWLYDTGLRTGQAVQAIGYKELFAYFDGDCPLDEAIEMLKQNSRRYAKRQLTWFRNKSEASWFDMTAGLTDQVFHEICTFVEGNNSSTAK
ncbi:tRNA (adenosine(37)-N6)-dimethylallyltransferase MiaA [Alkalihalobacillus oceani]|uniref:tRNA (adenosine(37)-N6)-dimethylallyltransferase MiaA n=1 Tax=Halalkalibacter oceani TaxID=1653776 RepID=UPI00203B0591|nr:tRNA (adenosine(37)-N6)-dimethylallyltransferase MiaA [Halalkalibacter oceani]MCM3761345.1 tRNA (adenosine(37)-N6)-dimethylallyltransferase MiaA [Halalkalibacter oceani]